jgi:hypothetical protein
MDTKDTNSYSTSRQVQLTVQSKLMGRITSLKSFKRTENKLTGRTPEDPEWIHKTQRTEAKCRKFELKKKPQYTILLLQMIKPWRDNLDFSLRTRPRA